MLATFIAAHVMCVPLGPYEWKKRHLLPAHNPSVVIIETACGMCSGFVAAKGLVMTSAHCTDYENHPVTVRFLDGHSRRFHVVYRAENASLTGRDTAVLRGDTRNTRPLSIGSDGGSEWCLSVGYGGPVTKQQAAPCFTRSEIDGLDRKVFKGATDHGDSGGPILDSDGKVIGQIESLQVDTTEFYAVPAEELRRVLEDVQEAK